MSIWSPQRRVLANGLVVIVQEQPGLESVVVRLSVAAGAVFEQADEAGLASLVARGLTRGTATRSKEQIGELLDFSGALLSGGGNRHTATLAGRCRAADLDALVELVAECAATATFPDEEVGKLIGDRLTLLREEEDDPAAVVMNTLREQLYPPEHPYARPVAGRRDSVAALTPERLRSFHRRHYAPDRACLVLVGDVTAARALALAEGRFGDWAAAGAAGFRASQPPIPPVAASPGPERRVTPLAAKPQVELALGRVGLRRRDPRYYAAALANTVIGEFALGGRLGRVVREERGMAYSIGSGLRAGPGPGPWVVRAGVQPEHVEPALACVREELDRAVREPPRGQELEDARAAVVRSLPRALESSAGVAGLLGQIELYDLGLEYPERFRRAIEGVTEAEVAAVVRELFAADGLAVSIAGPYGGEHS